MEKITLKPLARELLFKSEEPNTHCDVLTYTGANGSERTLGSLYAVGYTKYGEDEDLGYVLSLVSSLAKREYYSEASIRGGDPKKAFESTLKKLNEVLEDFFKNKSLTLNIGLAAIAGDQLLLSKLGKFKVGLARNGEYIDVLNNLMLFQKSDEGETQFSNIVSGKLYPGDKLFAYYPTRPITSRERNLQGVLLKETQQQFADKIALLASTAPNFACCGVHISLEQIKEIPIQAPAPAWPVGGPAPVAVPAAELTPTVKPAVVSAELSVAKKPTSVSSIARAASTLRYLNRLPIHKRFRGFIVIALLIVVPLFVIALVRASGSSSEIKTAYRAATENLKLAQAKLAQNDSKEARALLTAALANISSYQDTKIIEVRGALESALDGVDHASSVAPMSVRNLTEEETALAAANMLLATNAAKQSVWYNRSELLTVDTKSYKLKDPATAIDATLYEGNLYVLSANHIYKYAGALQGNVKRIEWGSESSDALQSIAADGNIYALMPQGTVTTYFKGERKGQIETSLPIDAASRIYAFENDPKLVITNPALKRAYVIDKTSGAILVSYKLDSIGQLKDAALDSDGVLWLLSADYKLWQLKP